MRRSLDLLVPGVADTYFPQSATAIQRHLALSCPSTSVIDED